MQRSAHWWLTLPCAAFWLVGWLAGIQERDALSHRVGELEQLTTTAVEAENAQLRVDNAALLEHLTAATASAAAAAQAPRTPHANYE